MEKYYDIAQVPYKRESAERILTGFKELDYDIKGLEIGITLVVGNTSVGKSTFIQGLISQAINQGYKTWVFSGEHTAQSFLQLIYHQNSNKEDYVPIVYKDKQGYNTNITDWYITEEREAKIKNKFANNLFIYSNKAPRNIDVMLDSMYECYKNENARFFVIDNMISIDNVTSNVFAEQTMITEKIRTFALNNKVIVLLVAHQRKIVDRGFRIDIQDVAGSQNISNKAYNVLALYRTDMIKDTNKEYDRFKQDLLKYQFDIDNVDEIIEVLKTKGNRNGLIGLKYNRDTKTYIQADKLSQTEADKIYQTKVQQTSLDDLDQVNDDDMTIPF